MATVAEYGSWKSPITPDVFSVGNAKALCELQANSGGVFWVEQNIVTGKRELYRRKYAPRGSGENERWAEGRSVQNAVHEYGGGALCLLSDGSVLFTTIEGVFRQREEGSVEQVADGKDKTLRFADITSSGEYAFCVLEDHSANDHNPDNRLCRIDLTTKTITDVAHGCDFYACPRLSPDGKKLVWMQWNHINMPWDETTIVVADLTDEFSISRERTVLSGVGKMINYYCPLWSPSGDLYIVCDKTNFWNVYSVDLEKNDGDGFACLRNIFPIDTEIGYPLWQFGDRPFATNGRNTIFNVNGKLKLRSADSILSVETPGYTMFSHIAITDTDVVYCLARGPRKSSTLLKIELHDTVFQLTPLRESRDSSDIDRFPISIPEEISYESDGDTVHGWFYPPKSEDFVGLPGALPPVILMGHGGPTAPAWDSLDFKKQFFTSRGFAVFDVNYRGSTGFGTEFRRKLYRNWGVVDRNDMIAGAKALAERGLVDPKKICIMGSSAGGFLLLSCLLHSDVFAAAVSMYGVADLESLAKDTHKFELGYNEVMIGKYPEEINLYKEKSPILHSDRLHTPIAFFHGTEDTVVPPAQSVEMHEKLKQKGILTALKMFPDEGHGFRSATAIRESTEGAYFFFCKALSIEPSISCDLEILNLKEGRKSGL